MPAALRQAQRLRNPGGPVPVATYSAVLLILGVWQVLLFVALRGWPVTLIRRAAVRLAARNAAVVLGTAGSFPLLWWATGRDADLVNAVGGTIIAAALLVSMLFDGWPATRLGDGAGRLGVLPVVGLVAAVPYLALSAYADAIDWTRTTADGWVALAAPNYLALGVVVHVAVWRRWPVMVTAAR